MDSAPIVLVGMPRSGSTLFSAILNRAPEVYLINDAYFLQEVDGRRAWQCFRSDVDARAFLNKIQSLVIRRSAVNRRKTLNNSSLMTEEQLDNACTVISNIEVAGKTWHAILAGAMTGAAQCVDKYRWGWNTPQDLYHIERINTAFPDSRFIFMMRDPFSVIRSFKYKQNKKASRRYHPLAQALAWKKAVKKYHAAQSAYPDRILLIKYEHLVSNTAREVERVNRFLNVSIPADLDLNSLGTNSSFRDTGGAKSTTRMQVSGIESWLVDQVLYRERSSLGYSSPRKRFSTQGAWPLLNQTISFFSYYLIAALSNSDIRKRVIRFIR
jgi:hypothetical protein